MVNNSRSEATEFVLAFQNKKSSKMGMAKASSKQKRREKVHSWFCSNALFFLKKLVYKKPVLRY